MNNMRKNRGEDDGFQHYRALGLTKTASLQDVKQAYRRLARVLHPDKGGDAAAFAALQAAFETLSDPKARAAYDTLAADLRFRPGAATPYSSSNQQVPAGPSPPAPGVTEAVLLQQLLQRSAAHPYAVFDPTRQLCVTCEVCRRPATQQCWTCGMDICEFCTRRQHWKGSISLHWPLVDQPGSMLEQLGRRELELKRRADGHAYKQAQPDYRPQAELLVLRQFQSALVDILQQQELKQQQPLSNTWCANTVYSSITSSSSSSSRTTTTTTTSSSSSSSYKPTAAASCTAGVTTAAAHQDKQHAGYPAQHTTHASKQERKCSSTPGQRQAQSAFALPTAGAIVAAPGPASMSNYSSSNSNSLSAAGSKSQGTLAAIARQSGALTAQSSSKTINKCEEAWRKASEATKQYLLSCCDNRLARFYMWTQTECLVLLAVHLPTGGGKLPPALTVDVTPSTILVKHKGFGPVLSRSWASPIDATAGVCSGWTSADGQLLVVRAVKAQPGRMWSCCFKGDSYLARHLQSPYHLLQLPAEVQMELPLPFWVEPSEDVQVVMNSHMLTVTVEGLMKLQRRFYWDVEQECKRGSSYQVVDSSRSTWCILSQQRAAGATSQQANSSTRPPTGTYMNSISRGHVSPSTPKAAAAAPATKPVLVQRAGQTLSISLALPDPTEEEVMYKKGVRQNNASVVRVCPNGAGQPGMAFMQEDEDEWGLQAVLQAMLFLEAGQTWITPKPWELAAGAASLAGSSSGSGSGSTGGLTGRSTGGLIVSADSGRGMTDEQQLPADVASHLQWLRAAVVARPQDEPVTSDAVQSFADTMEE